jgi:hypothetical protein
VSRQHVRRGVLRAGSEDAFQQAVVQLLGVTGWHLVYHTHDSRRSAAGFPDLVAVHSVNPWLLIAELKGATPARRVTLAEALQRPTWLSSRAITREQAAWLEALRRVEDAVRVTVEAHAARDRLDGIKPTGFEPDPRVIVRAWADTPDGWADIEATLGRPRVRGLH